MVFNILILIGIGIGVFLIVRKVFAIYNNIHEKLEFVNKTFHHPKGVAVQIGTLLANTALSKIKGFFGSGERQKKRKDL